MEITLNEFKWAKKVIGKKNITIADWLDLQFTDKYIKEKVKVGVNKKVKK